MRTPSSYTPNPYLAVPICILTLSLLCGFGAAIVHARQGPEPKSQVALSVGNIANVDLDSVYAASGGREELAQKDNELRIESARQLSDLASVVYLSLGEWLEYATLNSKTIKTEADLARLKALKALSGQQQDELSALQIKADKDLTPADKARMKKLQDMTARVRQTMPNFEQDMQADRAAALELFRRSQLVKLRTLIGRTAVEKGFHNVFEANSLVYSANDLTPLIVQRLTKKQGK